MNIKNLFKKDKPKHNINEDFSKILGFEQKDCSHKPISDIDNIEKFIIKNDNVDTYISSYSQNDINAGIILGMPSNLNPYFKQSINLVNDFFNKKNSILKQEEINPKDVLFLKPKIYADNETNTGRNCYLLPSIFTLILENGSPLIHLWGGNFIIY